MLFCYLDEAGNFDFGQSGTPYYMYTAMVTENPLELCNDLMRMRYLLYLNGLTMSNSHSDNAYFHATEDSVPTRELVFETLEKHADQFRAYTAILDKRTADEQLHEQKALYETVFERLISAVFDAEAVSQRYDHVLLLMDEIAVTKKRDATRGGLKSVLKKQLVGTGVGYNLFEIASESDYGLQAADYVSWSIHRKWTNNDLGPYARISRSIAAEVMCTGDK